MVDTAIGERVPSAEIQNLSDINSLLATLRLGSLDSESVNRYPGRHTNWVGVTDTGNSVFVKHLPNGHSDAPTMRRLIAAESALESIGVARPRCLGWDEHAHLIVFEFVTPARDGASRADDGEFTPQTAREVGRILAELHNSASACGPLMDSSEPPFPPQTELDALPLRAFLVAPAAELEVWNLLQRCPRLVQALRDVRERERGVERTTVHCDLRLDQLVIHDDGTVYLSDWDEIRLADPARDVGAFVGEWLLRATSAISDHEGGHALSHDDVVARGTAGFAAARPLIIEFWHEYRAVRRPLDAELAERAVSYAGWHQFDRLLAAARGRSRLLPIERAAAGIGRAAVLDPARFVSPLGLASQGPTAPARS